MELFTPEVGLLFWMLIPFLVVFFILGKYAWPAIIKGVNERSKFIDDSLESAVKANEQLANIKKEGEEILKAARQEKLQLLSDAAVIRNKLIEEAKQQAQTEAAKVLEAAKIAIAKEKEDAVRDIRRQVAELSVNIAEKVLRGQLEEKPKQMEMINRLLDEVNISKS